jgi:transcriptional antiterminator RfaH
MNAWYALHTKPQSEVQVHRALVARGFETYLPMLPPRKERHAQPLFPAYLFVRCDMEAIGIANLQWIPGLRRILAFAGRPAVVPDEAIGLIRSKMAEIDADGGHPRHHFKTGDRVVIERGVLSGMRGIFQGPAGPAERVQILIRFLGQENRAKVPVEDLVAAPDGDPEILNRRRGTRGHGRHVHYQGPMPGSDANTLD